MEKIQQTLEWCGLKPDEGPFYGHRFEPYYQVTFFNSIHFQCIVVYQAYFLFVFVF